MRLSVLLSRAYSVADSRIQGAKELLGARFDMRITLPQGGSGEAEVLRQALEQTLKLKVRRERREVDALVLRPLPPS
jgi:uncharacterized protein (TIGR03435 family)